MCDIFSKTNTISSILYRKDILHNGYKDLIKIIDSHQLDKISLSKNTAIKTFSTASVNCLDIDVVESRYLLCGSIVNSIALYDLASGKNVSDDSNAMKKIISPIAEIMNSQEPRNLSSISSIQWFSEDTGAFIASEIAGKVSIFDTNVFTPVYNYCFADHMKKPLTIHQARMRPPSSGAQTPLIAVGLSDCTIRLCDPRTGDDTHTLSGGHYSAVTCVEWHPGGVVGIGAGFELVTAGCDGVITVWDVRKAGKGALLRSFNANGQPLAHAVLDRSRNIPYSRTVTQQQSKIELVTNTQRQYRRVSLDIDKEVKSYYSSSLDRVAAHSEAVMSMKFSSCGRYLVSSGNDRKVRLWDAFCGRLISQRYHNNVSCRSPLPYSLGLIEAMDGLPTADVLLFPSDGKQQRSSYTAEATPIEAAHNARLRLQGIAPSSDFFAGGSAVEGDIIMTPLLPNARSDSRSVTPTPAMRILRGHMKRVTSIAYCKRSQQVVSCGKDGMILLWEPAVAQALIRTSRRNDRSSHRNSDVTFSDSNSKMRLELLQQRICYSNVTSEAAAESVVSNCDNIIVACNIDNEETAPQSVQGVGRKRKRTNIVSDRIALLNAAQYETSPGPNRGSASSRFVPPIIGNYINAVSSSSVRNEPNNDPNEGTTSRPSELSWSSIQELYRNVTTSSRDGNDGRSLGNSDQPRNNSGTSDDRILRYAATSSNASNIPPRATRRITLQSNGNLTNSGRNYDDAVQRADNRYRQWMRNAQKKRSNRK